MKVLADYLNSLEPEARDSYARRCGTTVGYLRKVASTGQRIGSDLCIKLDRESEGKVPMSVLRDDVDWAYVKRSAPLQEARASA